MNTYLHRPTARYATDATIVRDHLPDGRPWQGYLHALNTERRVGIGWYVVAEVEAAEPAETVYNDAAGVATVTRVVKPAAEPEPPKPEVVEAAMQLYEEIGRINATYKINLGVGSGYNATLNDVLKNPAIPVELRSLEYNILTNRFDQYAYRFGQWRENADAWAALAELAELILQP